MKAIILYLGVFILSMFCFAKAQGQGNCFSNFGTMKDTCWSKTAGYLWMPVYGTAHPKTYLSPDIDGKIRTDTVGNGTPYTAGFGIGISNDTILVDSTEVATRTYVDNEIDSVKRQNRVLGTLYNASTWSDLSDFDTNYNGVSIVGGNINLSGGSADTPTVLSWDYFTRMTSWQMTSQFVVEENSATSKGIAHGIYGTGREEAGADVSTFALLDLSTNATQGGKLFIRTGTNPNVQYWIDSTTAKLPIAVGDTIVLTTKWEFIDFRIYATNITQDTAISLHHHFHVSLAFTPDWYQYNTGKFSIWSRGGEITLDSLNVSSETVKDVDIAFIGDSKTSCIGVTNINKCFSRIVQKHYPNSIIYGGIGDYITDKIRSLPELLTVNPKQALINIYYNDLWRLDKPVDTFTKEYAQYVDSLDAHGIASYKMTPQDYPSAAYPAIRAKYDSFRVWLYATYPTSEIIDAFYDMEKCGTPCLFFGAHPNDTGHAVIANKVINSHTLTGASEVHELIERIGHDNIDYIQEIIDDSIAAVRETTTWQQVTNAGKITDDTVTAQGIRVNTGLLTVSSNIGVGTQNPQAEISLPGGDTCTIEIKGVVPGLKLRYANGNDSSKFTLFVDNDVYFYSHEEGTTQRFRFHHGSKNLFRIVSDVNGANIGTYNVTNPRARLEITAGNGTIAPLIINSGTLLGSPLSGTIEYDGTSYHATNGSTVRGIVRVTRTLVSSAATLILGNANSDYVFSGTTSTWTLPVVAGTLNITYRIKNRGSGAITLNSNAGGNDIYSSSAVNTLTINPGESIELISDGTYWNLFD